MICDETWPNYTKGSDRLAAQAILKSQGVESDCTYGNTKVFIQNAETVFNLERAREAKIPSIVLVLQTRLRGVLARRVAAKMRAAYRIGLFYRKYQLRTYVNLLRGTFK